MTEQKTVTTEEMEQQIQQLQYQLESANKREEMLANKLGHKEREIADLTIRLEQVSQGYQYLQQVIQESQSQARNAEEEVVIEQPNNEESGE